jgi:hypothetical protein
MSRSLGIAFCGPALGRETAILHAVRRITRGGVAPDELPIGERADLAPYDDIQLAGWFSEPAEGLRSFPPISTESRESFLRERLTLWEKVEALVADLDLWRLQCECRPVVISLAPSSATAEPFDDLTALLDAFDDNSPAVTAAHVHAFAALEAGLPFAALGEGTPASEPALHRFAESQGLPVTATTDRKDKQRPEVLAALLVETARCLDLAARRRMAGQVDAFDALFAERRPGVVGGTLHRLEQTTEDSGGAQLVSEKEQRARAH